MGRAMQDTLNAALQKHTAGDLAGAEALYRQVLQQAPRHPVALHMLGGIAIAMANMPAAAELISAAIAEQPDYFEAHSNLGHVLLELGRNDEAIAHCERAIATREDFPEAHFNLANALHAQQRYEGALQHYQRALALNPDYAAAWANLGLVQQELGQGDAAIDSFNQALAREPNFAQVHNNLGNLFTAAGKLDRAVQHYQQALAIAPAFAEARSNLGIVHKQRDEHAEAIACLQAADPEARHPKNAPILLELYYITGDYAAYDRQLALIAQHQPINFRTASTSAFAAQQLGRDNPYRFCDTPLDFVECFDLIASGDVDAAMIEQIKQAIADNRACEQFAPGHITEGYKSVGNLFLQRSAVIAPLEQSISRCIAQYREQRLGDACPMIEHWPERHSLDGWYIRLLRGGEVSAHTHEGWLSGVFYLDVPEDKSCDDGNIEFTLRGYDLPVRRDDYPRKTIETRAGLLVLFPSSLPHRVLPFAGERERISIAFDLIPSR